MIEGYDYSKFRMILYLESMNLETGVRHVQEASLDELAHLKYPEEAKIEVIKMMRAAQEKALGFPISIGPKTPLKVTGDMLIVRESFS